MANKKKIFYSIIGLIEIVLLAVFILFAMYLELVLLIPIICFTIVIAGVIEFKRGVKPAPEYSDTAETLSYEEAEGLPEDKIVCPNCEKQIPEGLTFCPECGERIPPEGLFNA
jgi:CBS domain containing-hemolysin-like protein